MQNRTVATGLAGLWIVGAVLVAAHGKAQVSYSGDPRAASTENLNGQMPADFDREVARVVAARRAAIARAELKMRLAE